MAKNPFKLKRRLENAAAHLGNCVFILLALLVAGLFFCGGIYLLQAVYTEMRNHAADSSLLLDGFITFIGIILLGGGGYFLLGGLAQMISSREDE